jgi:predicted amidohydrolase
VSELALVAVQVRLALHHLESAHAFQRMIDELAEQAGAVSADAAHRLFVFPEGVGYFLPLASAPSAVLEKATVDEAFAALAVRKPLTVVRGLVRAGGRGLRKGVLAALLPEVDRVMKEVFAGVARRHRATVVAGSHLVARSGGRVTNTSYTFDPAGRLVATTDKVNLVPTLEDSAGGGLDLSRGDADGIPLYRAPWGSLATLICYDGFREPHTRGERWAFVGPRVDAAGARIIANPAANSWPWHERWYFAEPGEEILRIDQWRTEGLPATLSELSAVEYGVTAHLCGRIMDQEFEGASEILARDDGRVRVLARASHHDQAEIVTARVPADGQFAG